MQTPEFWKHDELTARLLAPAGELYALGSRLRRRFTTPQQVGLPIVCVGNLTVGGAGKTPVAIAIAERLSANGERPHLVSRGYGGRLHGPLRVDPARHDASLVGDEALLLARVATTWVARDRLAGIEAAAGDGASVAVLDDGFQNPSLAPDLALVVVDGTYGFGNGRVLPAGPLREPVAVGLRRAHAVVRLGTDDVGVGQRLPAGMPCIEAELRAGPDAPDLTGRRVVAFAGIGRPEKLFTTLRQAGAELIAGIPFPDHHRYRRTEVESLLARARRVDAVCVTTSKDAVRLPADLRAQVAVLPITVTWRNPAAVDQMLQNALRPTSRDFTL